MAKRNTNGVKASRYVPTEWATGDVITAEKLNNMESGISAAESAAEAAATAAEAVAPFVVAVSGLTADDNVTASHTFAEIKAAYEAGKNIEVYYNNTNIPPVTFIMKCDTTYQITNNTFSGLTGNCIYNYSTIAGSIEILEISITSSSISVETQTIAPTIE